MVLRLRLEVPDNWRKAKCRSLVHKTGEDPFFDDEDEAIHMCNGTYDGQICPIRHECLLFALTNNCSAGVWGGTMPVTRKALRKRWPLKGRQPHSEWQWVTEEEATTWFTREELEAEEEDDDPD